MFNLTGHGFLDLGAYDAFLSGKLEDYDHPEEAIEASIAKAAEGRLTHRPTAFGRRCRRAAGRCPAASRVGGSAGSGRAAPGAAPPVIGPDRCSCSNGWRRCRAGEPELDAVKEP